MNPIVNPTVDPIVNTAVNPTPPKDQDLPERPGTGSFYYSYEEGGGSGSAGSPKGYPPITIKSKN